eukprot:scaffold34685_cov183-Amphora_coffeaeformis.AAC.39
MLRSGRALYRISSPRFRQSYPHRVNTAVPRSLSSLPAAPPDSEVPAIPIDFWTAAKIEGEESHTAIVTLKPGERLRAESGAMLFMTEGVVMDTKLAGASSAFSRFLTGQNVFLTDYCYDKEQGEGTVGLGTDFPSKILRFTLEDYGGSLICQRGAFLASNPTVNIEMEFTKSLTAGFFGGQGFVLQRLRGDGDVLIKGGGTVVERELAEGEVLRVTSGSLVAFSPTISYEVGMMPGIKNVMFGGEGLFVTTMTGPGQVWLQGMPPDRMIAEIVRRIPGPGLGVPIFMGGGGGGGADTAGEGGVDGVAGSGDETAAVAAASDGGAEAVAATDAAVEADRQATVAASGMDTDSPSALFGEFGNDSATTASSASAQPDMESASSSTISSEASYGLDESSTFGDDSGFSDQTSFSNETTFQDGIGDSSFGDSQDSGGMLDDTTVEGLGGGEEASDQGGSILSFIWDLINGDD